MLEWSEKDLKADVTKILQGENGGYLMGMVLVWKEEKVLETGKWWWLHNDVSILNAPELYLNVVKVVNLMYALPRSYKNTPCRKDEDSGLSLPFS